MSKSLSHLFLPVFGGTALIFAVAISFANRDYRQGRIAALETRIDQVEAHEATARQVAEAEAVRAADLELKIAEVQAAASARVAGTADLTTPAPLVEGTYGIGRPALVEEIAAWDVDILPDGRGLPAGSGDVWTGEEVFAERCASCHGDFAEGVGNWPVLAGGFDTLGDKDPVKTVGSYWPHLSTAWDYISRSMPFGEAGTLTADETYAIVAYILYSNDLVDDDFELSKENFADFEMYNMEGFVIDDRPDAEYAQWRAEPCMEGCKDAVEVTMRTVFLVETPAEGGSNSVMNHSAAEALPSFTADGPSFIPAAAVSPDEEADASSVTDGAGSADDAAILFAAGEKVFKRCSACHKVGEGARNGSGPHLNGLLGRTMGSVDGFRYSGVFAAAMDEGRVWDEAALAEFLANPKSYMAGTKMAFSGLRKEADVTAVTEYLRSFVE
ncbi:MAG: c-type cytochrome [Pseudomonadota bacterium]